MVDWKDNYEEDTTDPQDGGDPICVWWEDIHPWEVRDLVKKAYERGLAVGQKLVPDRPSGDDADRASELAGVLVSTMRRLNESLGIPAQSCEVPRSWEALSGYPAAQAWWVTIARVCWRYCLHRAGEVCGIRPEVLAFARHMEGRLRENDHKGGWHDAQVGWLIMRIREELRELEDAYTTLPVRSSLARLDHVVHEAADVANFCMMVADNVRGLVEDADPAVEVKGE